MSIVALVVVALIVIVGFVCVTITSALTGVNILNRYLLLTSRLLLQ